MIGARLTFSRKTIARAVCAAVCALASIGARAAEAPNLPLQAESVTIPFANAAPDGGPLDSSPRLWVGFDGGARIPFVMDTGSTGVVVSKTIFTPPAGAEPIGPGKLVYTSSGRVIEGRYYAARVDIGPPGRSAVAQVPVLVVDRETCWETARDCAPQDNPAHVAMFGVGFGQEGAGQPHGTPDKNPFLNIVAINGSPVRDVAKGYVVTREGVTLGLTAAAAAGFRFARLARRESGDDWSRLRATIAVGGASGPATVLADTGIRYMFLRPPPGVPVATLAQSEAAGPCVRFGPCAAEGVRIHLAFGDPAAPALEYDVMIGAGGRPLPSASAPPWVTVLRERDEGFVNTGFHFFNAYDYLYDAADGYVGFRPHAASPRP